MAEIASLSVDELKAKLDRGDAFLLLDVREPEEFAFANIGGVPIPLGELPSRLAELDRNTEIVVLCHHGVRSLHAAHFLLGNGFSKLANVRGGIDQWSVRVDGNLGRY